MADNKLYITQLQENGAVMISEDVIATVIAHAVSEVEGAVGLIAKPGSDIAEKIGKKRWSKGVKLTIDEENTLAIDCNINVSYGQNVVTVALAAQDAIAAAVESTTGVKVRSVNVNVCGITR